MQETVLIESKIPALTIKVLARIIPPDVILLTKFTGILQFVERNNLKVGLANKYVKWLKPLIARHYSLCFSSSQSSIL